MTCTRRTHTHFHRRFCGQLAERMAQLSAATGPEGHIHNHAAEGHAGHAHEHAHDHGSSHAGEGDSFWLVGASLASGFAFMLVVDRLSAGYGHAHESNPPGSHRLVLDCNGRRTMSLTLMDWRGVEGSVDVRVKHTGCRQELSRVSAVSFVCADSLASPSHFCMSCSQWLAASKPVLLPRVLSLRIPCFHPTLRSHLSSDNRSAMIGLIVHAAVDGVALGMCGRGTHDSNPLCSIRVYRSCS